MSTISVQMNEFTEEAVKVRVKELAKKYPKAWIFVDGKTAYSPASGKVEKEWR